MSGRTRAADDFAAIRARVAELAADTAPRCPVPGRPAFVFDCLRHAVPCPDNCDLRGDWIGPAAP